MIMAAADCYWENSDPSEEQVRHGLEGNLCRCTGYQQHREGSTGRGRRVAILRHRGGGAQFEGQPEVRV
jgi:carbon-monoxide dehydrogenase small subunit